MAKRTTRRRVLSVSGLGALGVLGGCSGTSSPDGGSPVTDRTTTRTETEVRTTRTRTASPEPEKATEPSSPGDEAVRRDQRADTLDFSDDTLARAKELGRTVQRSVVKPTSDNVGGTGWVIENGYILTNSHVTREFETMDVETLDERSGTATRVGYHEDPFPDIALLKTDTETPAALPTETNTEIAEGDPVLAVGHPGRVGGWVISLGRYETCNPVPNWEPSDIPTSQGTSGSPIVTLDGVVFGCISGTTTRNGSSSRVDRSERVYTEFPEQERLATATPSKTIEKWVREWK